MTSTLRPKRFGIHSPDGARLAIAYGELTGRTEKSASQRLWGKDRLDRDASALLMLLKARGDRAGMDAFMRPLLGIYNDVNPEPLTDELLCEAARTNAAEEVERSEFQARKTDSELEDLKRASLKDAVTSYRVYDSCVAELRRRRGNA